ncbi:MAG: kynureninase [Proteobacteria bacterium]|nr:kynureninase [Pseudomonadota bacterium]
MSLDLAAVRALDASDPLRAFRDRFDLPDGVIYMDGNSLGPLPRTARAALTRAVDDEWGRGLIRSWNDAGWIDAPRRVGDRIAGLIGASPGEVVVADSTSVNLFKLAAAAVGARPGRRVILTEAGNFPTDLYIAQGLAAVLPAVQVRAVPADEIAAHLGPDVALLQLSHVHYKSARRHDMAALTTAAQAAGALTLWDLSHSAGAIEVDLNGCNADLAVGCGYKFLNGGPGAPAFLFVAARHQARLVSPLAGWMGHAAPFDFVDEYRPAPGVERFLCGTPSILALTALEAGVEIAAAVDAQALAAKAKRLIGLFITEVEARCPTLTLASPRHGPRGSHVSFAHPEGYRIMRALIARGLIGDFREPDILRFGITPLYLGYEDVWRAAQLIQQVLDAEAWRDESVRQAGRVT